MRPAVKKSSEIKFNRKIRKSTEDTFWTKKPFVCSIYHGKIRIGDDTRNSGVLLQFFKWNCADLFTRMKYKDQNAALQFRIFVPRSFPTFPLLFVSPNLGPAERKNSTVPSCIIVIILFLLTVSGYCHFVNNVSYTYDCGLKRK